MKKRLQPRVTGSIGPDRGLWRESEVPDDLGGVAVQEDFFDKGPCDNLLFFQAARSKSICNVWARFGAVSAASF